jgi:hypothetical protein
MTTPTEREIREAINTDWKDRSRSWPYLEMTASIEAIAPMLWEGLDPSEEERLDYLLGEAKSLAESEVLERFREEVTEATVRALLQFAEEYPDAPRAQREGVPA